MAFHPFEVNVPHLAYAFLGGFVVIVSLLASFFFLMSLVVFVSCVVVVVVSFPLLILSVRWAG